MGSLLTLRPGHARLPDLTPLPDGRYRLTVYQKLPAAHYVAPEYGTLYDDTLTGDELARYSGLRLINIDPGNERYKPSVPSVTLVYEQLHATLETQVGKLTTVTDENDREVLQAQFIQFSSAAYVKGVIGTLTPPGVATAVLDGESSTDEGILRKITRKYVQAGATFESIGEDEIDYELNGLKRRVRNLVARGGVAFTGTVGATTHPTDTGLILAGLSIRESAATTKVKATYLQPGVVSKSRSAGEITGTIANSWQVFHSDPVALMTTALGSIVVTADNDSNVQGYPTRAVTAMTGTLTGVKFTYPAPIEVTTPGTITLQTVAITAGGLSGTDAVIRAVPPRKKTVTATVTIQIVSSPPATVANAYNLENISCSVTNTRASYSYKGSDIYTTTGGTNSMSVPKYGASIGADVSTYPGYYISGSTTATGSFTYTAGSEASGLNTNLVVVTPLTATITNTLTGSGSTTATGYETTGILEQKARPVLTALNGTTYWELITWTV